MRSPNKAFFEEEQIFVNPNTRIYATPIATHYTIYLDDTIEAPCHYRDETNLLNNVGEDDHVKIVINSMGGHMSTAIQLCNAIGNCAATVETELSGSALSAGSMIFLAASANSVLPSSEMMIHNASGGVGGKMEDMSQYIEHSKKLSKAFLERIYDGFLTQDEIDDVARGIEMYFDYDQIVERLERRAKHFEAKYGDSDDSGEMTLEQVMEALREAGAENIKVVDDEYSPASFESFKMMVKGMKFKDARERGKTLTGVNPKSWDELYNSVEDYFDGVSWD